jgi:hypothetical protein
MATVGARVEASIALGRERSGLECGASTPSSVPMSTDALVRRARRLARQLEELAATVDRYAQLGDLHRQPRGRAPARRDAMRAINARFPGALRELDAIGADRVAGRGVEAQAALAAVLRGVEIALADALAARRWLAALLELQPRLRELVRLKHWLVTRHVDTTAADARAAVRAWYDGAPGGRDPETFAAPDVALIDAVAAPPDGQVQRLAYRAAADEMGITVDALKTLLYATDDEQD